MSLQKANAALVSLLEPFFTRRREFYGDGARLLSAVLATHREGGGDLRWGWLADSLFLHGQAAAAGNALTGVNISSADYFATANGGPYVDFDGATEYLDSGDRAWAEVGAEEFLVWQWCNPRTVTGVFRPIVSKYGAGGSREWLLALDTTDQFRAYVSGDGTATVGVANTHGVVADTNYFTAFFFQPSTLLRIYVGAASDSVLTINSLAAGIPAAIFAGTASFRMGWGSWAYWNGYLGPGFGRCNVPAANVDGYVARLFHLGRWFYE